MEDLFGGFSTEIWRSRIEEQSRQARLQNAIWGEFRLEPLLEDAEMAVEVEGDTASLVGTVRNYPAKLAAERAAKRVPGLRTVRNSLAVVLRFEDRCSDEDLTRIARRELARNVLVPYGQVTPRVSQGQIALHGEVEREHQRVAAEEAVGHLIGVIGVTNHITVRAPVAPSTWGPAVVAEFRAEAEEALRHRPEIQARHIKVEAHGDTIVLRGRVASLAEREAAERAAWAVPGVHAVEDDLEVRA